MSNVVRGEVTAGEVDAGDQAYKGAENAGSGEQVGDGVVKAQIEVAPEQCVAAKVDARRLNVADDLVLVWLWEKQCGPKLLLCVTDETIVTDGRFEGMKISGKLLGTRPLSQLTAGTL
ncbi:MAG: hypothetical protein K9L82_16640 [Chromatiaceae bacterium]|nr:hypothetical protein [Chromatiaceae bacterium]MCF8015740.1 hypothetical protein [Chromatiaceae bacterium]